MMGDVPRGGYLEILDTHPLRGVYGTGRVPNKA